MTEAILVPDPDSGASASRWRELLRLGIPLVAGMGGHALFNIVDLAMVGAYHGEKGGPTDETLAAVGIASLVTTAPIVFMNGIANGAVTVVARAYAGGQMRRANQYARQGLLLAGLLSVLLGVIPAVFADSIATGFGATSGWERSLTIDFLRLLSFNAWSAFLLMQATANLRAVGMSMWTMTLLLFSNVGNIVGNWCLVFGKFGFPEYGPMGSAYATVIARGAAALAAVGVLAWAHPAVRLSATGWLPRARFMWKVTRAGLPVALQWTVRMAAITLVLFVVGRRLQDTGDALAVEQAAFSVGTRLDTLALFAGLGWGAACAALVSHGVGRGHAFALVRRVARDSAVLNVVMMSVVGALYFWFADDLVRLFSLRGGEPPPPDVIQAGVRYLRVSVLSYPALAVCVVWAHAMNGVGSVKTPLVLDTVGLLCLQVPLAWYLSGYGILGAWWALVISHTILAAAYWLVFHHGAWSTKKRR
jgi:multidrug resistance protein, MATE family